MRNILNLILILLTITSAILLTVTIVSFSRDIKKRNRYSECTGVIIRILKQQCCGEDHNDREMISPIVSYTVGGKQYEFVGTTYTPKIQVGEEVTVLYDPDDPSQAVLERGLYFVPLITGIIGLSFAAAVVLITVLRSVGIIML